MLSVGRLGIRQSHRRGLHRWTRIAAYRHASSAAQSSTASEEGELTQKEAWLFINSVFPIRFAQWDPRSYLISFQKDDIISRLDRVFSTVKADGFQLISLEPRTKDGGVFAHIKYTHWPEEKGPDAIARVIAAINSEADLQGGVPSWFGSIKKGQIWPVKGQPWLEDMNRFAFNHLKVEFEGPDVHVEDLWELFRPYGRILEISSPVPVPAGTLRSSTVIFSNLHAAVIARNCNHGDKVVGLDGKLTRLAITFDHPLKAHYIRDWLSSHPRIVIPVVVFLLGTLTYTIFDPIRELAVQGKIQHWFEWRDYHLVKWLRKNTLDRLEFRSSHSTHQNPEIWKERQDSERAIDTYLHDLPETVSFVHGPQGSGKTTTLRNIINQNERRVLMIDCNELFKSGSDSGVLQSLALQTGYWPLFTFLNSINSMLDLAAIGVIGKPAGLSTSMETQLNEMLSVIGSALERVQSSFRSAAERDLKAQWAAVDAQERCEYIESRIKAGTWHDGRLDCVAGNGVMSELGVGDEPFGEKDSIVPPMAAVTTFEGEGEKGGYMKNGSSRNRDPASYQNALRSSVDALPVVVIKNYASRSSASREELLNALATWAAKLVKEQTAHVFVVSDNRENARRIARALPSSPLAHISFSDADPESALGFVSSKLEDASVKYQPTSEEIALIGRLGGRASDLETLIHKVRNGETINFAVEDIVNRGVSELRKTAFGDDVEDSKALMWSREQAWVVIKQLADKTEIPYYDTLLNFPFKGNEIALRGMEQAELVTITIQDGRPSSIKVGKPVFKWVFQRLVKDHVFYALQEINLNEKLLATAESTIQSCESELSTLKDMIKLQSSWNPLGSSTLQNRIDHLVTKMDSAEKTRSRLEVKNSKLKKNLQTFD